MKQQTKKGQRLFIAAALVLVAKAASDDLRICNYDEDLQVEFSECDAYGSSRNGKFD